MQEEVSNLKKAKTAYIQRHQEWERCRDAARIAEQGAEIGATAENKVNYEFFSSYLYFKRAFDASNSSVNKDYGHPL